MKLTRKPTHAFAVRWNGDNLQEIRSELSGVPVIFDGGALQLLAGKGGAQGYVPVPVGHWIFTDGSGDDWWPVEHNYVLANYDQPSEAELLMERLRAEREARAAGLLPCYHGVYEATERYGIMRCITCKALVDTSDWID